MKERIRRFSLLIISLLMTLSVNADSLSMSTVISSVANGVNGIGMGLFPVSMTYSHGKSFQLIPDYANKASFSGVFSYSLANSSMDGNYDYLDGTPRWAYSTKEDDAFNFKSGSFFNPNAYMQLSVSQGLGIKKNPVTKGNLLTLTVGTNIRYSNPVELTALSLSPSNPSYNKGNPFFVDASGNPAVPFTDDYELKAFPWLEGDRRVLNSYIYSSISIPLYKSTGFNTYDGASLSFGLEYGPSWLFNKMSNGVVSSDYLKLYGSTSEKITLSVEKQADGKNWLSSHLGHTCSFGYTFGDVVPQYKIPSDRLRGYINNQIWLNWSFPQFIATDCYAYIQIGLNNYIYFGKVANEVSGEHKAAELNSSLSGTFHMRLFGFVRFQYDVSYSFNRGIWASNPGWSQNAELRFWVAI